MHPNEELMRKGYTAFAKGDMMTIDTLMSDDIVWHVPGNNPVAGTFKGKNEIFALFGSLMELRGGTFKAEPHAILADDEHAVALAKVRADHERERTLSSNDVQVFHDSGGRITEQWLYLEADQDDFWS